MKSWGLRFCGIFHGIWVQDRLTEMRGVIWRAVLADFKIGMCWQTVKDGLARWSDKADKAEPRGQVQPSEAKGRTVNGSSAHIESGSSAHIANESSAHRETGSSAHIERSSAHIDAGYQPFRVWLGGGGGQKRPRCWEQGWDPLI